MKLTNASEGLLQFDQWIEPNLNKCMAKSKQNTRYHLYREKCIQK